MMEGFRLWMSFLFLGFQTIESSAVPKATRAVTWTLYENLKLTWNDASKFCMMENGHLPVTHTAIAMNALQTNIRRWTTNSLIDGVVWIGLHSPVPGLEANVWEEDCSSAAPDVKFWDSSEPNYLSDDLCIRIAGADSLWRTIKCNRKYPVVCERTTGSCNYEPLSDVTLTREPAASKAYVHDASTCWSLCLGLRVDGKECVAAVLDRTSALCKFYLGDELLSDSSQLVQSPLQSSTTMLRRCFHANVVTNWTVPGVEDTSIIPKPARGDCAVSYWSDNLPDGVVKGLAPTTTAATVTTATTQSPQTKSTPSVATTTTTTIPDEIAETTTTSEVTTEKTTTSSPSGTVTSGSISAVPGASTSARSNGCPNVPTAATNPSGTDGRVTTQDYSEDLLISANSTSKYKRSKTSAAVTRTSHAVIGSTWILASASVLAFFVLCDIPRLKRWGGGRLKETTTVSVIKVNH